MVSTLPKLSALPITLGFGARSTRRGAGRKAGATAAGLALPLMVGAGRASAAPAAPPPERDLRAGAVYAATNQAGGNAIAAYSRGADGILSPAGIFPTGGTGTGSGLGSQGAIALSQSGQWLYAVNAGSNDISVLSVGAGGLGLVQRVPSGGQRPISLTASGELLYVLNAGGSGSITGFAIGKGGMLSLIPGPTQGLGGSATGPAQVGFTPDGSTLVVTEKAANAVVTYAVDGAGRAGPPVMHPSSGTTPFGFTFAGRDTLVVSEAAGGAAGQSTVSSYLVAGGAFQVRTAAMHDLQTAACWAVATESGRFAYIANAGSDSISGVRVDANGMLSLLDANGVTAAVGAGRHPTDMALSAGSRYLYALDAFTGEISGFAVNGDGSLSPLGAVPGLPAGAVGLAAR